MDFKVKVMDVAGPDGRPKRVKVTVWDTAGQERFRTLTSSYYRGAQGIILGENSVFYLMIVLLSGNELWYTLCVCTVYDVARKETFDSLGMWLQEVEQYSMGGGKEVVKLLVGNKVDQPRVVSRETADEWARSRGMLFLEASAKAREGINQVFNEVVQKVSETLRFPYKVSLYMIFCPCFFLMHVY